MNFPRLNSKGQEAGPFELLVAVIMMAFVLIVGYQAIEIVKFNECHQQNDKALEDFRAKLEEITRASVQTNIAFSLDACAPKKDQTLTLDVVQDPAICAKQCSTARPTCLLLKLYNPKFSSIKCVNMKPQTLFADSGTCGSMEGYSAIDLKATSDITSSSGAIGIPEGFWIFKNITSANNQGTPIICAFYRSS